MGQIERMINWSRFNYSYARKQGELGARQKISIIYSQNITPTLSERLFFSFFFLSCTHSHTPIHVDLCACACACTISLSQGGKSHARPDVFVSSCWYHRTILITTKTFSIIIICFKVSAIVNFSILVKTKFLYFMNHDV